MSNMYIGTERTSSTSSIKTNDNKLCRKQTPV
jgi:hypothetical protein